MSHIFVSKALGDAFMNIIEQPLDLANIVDSEVMDNIKSIILTIVSAAELLSDVALSSCVCRWSPALQCWCALSQGMMPADLSEI